MDTTLKGQTGWPIVGETIPLFADPYEYAKQRMDRYGPIFKTSALGKPTVVMLTAEAQRYVLVTHQDNFLTHSGYGFLDSLLGGALIMLDGTPHEALKSLMTPAFHARNMDAYLQTINRVIDQHFNTWGTSGERGIYPDFQHITFELGAALLLGIDLGNDMSRLLNLWLTFADGVKTVLQIPGPFTKYGRAMLAKQQIDAVARTLIAKAQQSEEQNIIHLLATTRSEAGQSMSLEDLVTQVRFLLFAAFDTTTSTMAWLVTELLRHPQILDRVRAEVGADQRQAPITLSDLQHKPYLDALINETLRLYPQVMQFIRGVATDDMFEGFPLQRGWNVLLMPAFTHRRPDYFTDPFAFVPERFLPPREEQKRTPYSFVGYGGGMHACLGEGVARLEIKALLTALLRRFAVTLQPDQDLRQVFVPLSRPKSDVLVAYEEC